MSDSDSDASSQPEPDDLDSSEDAVDERGKRSKQQQARPRKQRNTSGLGGTRRVGASGKQRSVGKYGAGMLEERPDCWGPLCKGPHKASVQATDAELEECLATKHQMEGRDLQQHITDVNLSLGLKRKIQADVKLQINIKHTDLIKDMSLGIQAYQLGMQKHLMNKEWATDAYEKAYNSEIYGSEY